MAKSKRKPRAKNKIDGFAGELIKVDPEPFPGEAAEVRRTQEVKVTRNSYFTADFEALIEMIALDRVYRAMRDRWWRRPKLEAPEEADSASDMQP